MIHSRTDVTFLSKLLKPFYKRSKHKKHPHPTFQQLSKENLKAGREKKRGSTLAEILSSAQCLATGALDMMRCHSNHFVQRNYKQCMSKYELMHTYILGWDSYPAGGR